MDEEKLKELFAFNLQIGIPGVEQGPDGYRSQNPTSTAAGKYQFLEYWLKKAGKDSIQSFAQDLYGKIETMEDFKNNPQLQDDYFNHYAKTVLYDQAKTLSGKNPGRFSLDEIGAILHFDGYPNAQKQIDSGVLKDKQEKGVNGAKHDNLSGYDYLEKFNKTLNNNDLKPISTSTFKSDKDKESIVDHYKKKEAQIERMDISQGSKEKLRKNLWQEVYDQGNVDIINEYIKQENVDSTNEYNKARNLEKVLEGTEVHLNNKTKSLSFTTDADAEGDLKQAVEDYPNLFKGHTMVDDRNFFNYDTGKEKIYLSQTQAKNFSKRLFDLNQSEEINVFHDQTTGNKIWDMVGSFIPNIFKPGGSGTKETLFKGKAPDAPKERAIIDPSKLKEKKRVNPHDNKEEIPVPKVIEKKEVVEETSGTEPLGLADQFFQTQLGLNSVDDDHFNYEAGERELPIDAITGFALGLIGNEQAKNAKIPLRTEDVSEAFKNYTAELSKKAKEGIPIEIEAAMKNQLADVYQGGLASIVNASAGNRATVLGNLGSLEQAKTKGLVSIQVADYEAKDRAFALYGRATQYINDFNARRDIANHGIKYTEAKTKQIEGKQLATAGFAKLIDALKYERENGPGSPADQYRSYFMQRAYGFDPKQPDNMLGDTPGTKSFYDKNKALTTQTFTDTKAMYDRYGALNPNQKKAFNSLIGETQDKKQMGGFLDYMEQNPDADLSKVKMNNLDLAIKNEDFSLLSQNRKNILDPKGLDDVTKGHKFGPDPYDPNAPEPFPNLNDELKPKVPGAGLGSIPQIENIDEYFLNQ